MNYAVWNTLHDSGIKSATGTVPGEVRVQIEIAYLCGKLPTAAKELRVDLRQCSHFEFQPFQGESVENLEDIGRCTIEILSATLEGEMVTIVCVEGLLKLAYEDAEIRLMEGQLISQMDLETAADRYWKEWETKNAPT